MKSHSRLIKGIFLSFLVAMTMSLAVVPNTYAVQQPYEYSMNDVKPVKAQPQTDITSVVKKVADLVTFTHSFFLPVISFFSYQIGNFLGSDYVYNGSMGQMLQKIWVISRNLVNIAFVFILLYLALRTIFDPKFGTDELKTKLLTFVLLLVAVNFSWLATKVVLDAANVATNIVFAIPSGISNPPNYGKLSAGKCEINAPNEPIKGACYPTAIMAPSDSGRNPVLYWEDTEGDSDNCAKVKKGYMGQPDSAYKADGTLNVRIPDKYDTSTGTYTPSPGGASEINEKLQHRTSICVENLNLFSYNQNTATIYLTYGMARIQNLVNSTAGTGDAPMLAVGSLMSLIMQLAYTVSLIFLFIVLIIRMGMLWLFVAFSPFMVMVLWFKDGNIKEDQSLGKYKFGFHEFTNWAFAPVKVGAVFAVSFIMISAGQSMGDVKTTLVDKVLSGTGFVFQILEPQSFFMGIGSLQTLIWLIMSLVVMWMGVFAVLSDMSIIGPISQKIGGWGNYIGEMIATSPYWAPVLPLGKGGERQSIAKTVSPLVGDIQDVKAKYEAAMHPFRAEDSRKLQQLAAKNDFSDYGRKAATNSLSPDDAAKIAKNLGFKDLTEMMAKDKDTVVAALRTANVTGGNETKLYDRLNDLAKSSKTSPAPVLETPVQREQTVQDIAEGNRRAAASTTQNPPPAKK